MAKLKVFKDQYLLNLESQIDKNIDAYINADEQFFIGSEGDILTSSFEIPDAKPILQPNQKNEAENAINIYEYLPIDNTIASDPRIWAYLAHTQFCKYVIERWNINSKDDSEKIHQRFFLNGNARSLRRHAIARLWWAAKLTVEPWKTSEKLSLLKKNDKYYYTRVLMRDESLASDIVERPQLSSSPILFIGILEFLDKHPKYNGRSFYREFLKEIILTLGYRKIMTLDLDTLLAELGEIANDISKRSESSEGQQ